MIFEWFVDQVLGTIVTNLLGLVPELQVTVPALGPIFGMMRTLDAYVPVSEMLAGTGVILSVTLVMLVWRLVRIFLSHVPGIGGSG